MRNSILTAKKTRKIGPQKAIKKTKPIDPYKYIKRAETINYFCIILADILPIIISIRPEIYGKSGTIQLTF